MRLPWYMTEDRAAGRIVYHPAWVAWRAVTICARIVVEQCAVAARRLWS